MNVGLKTLWYSVTTSVSKYNPEIKQSLQKWLQRKIFWKMPKTYEYSNDFMLIFTMINNNLEYALTPAAILKSELDIV